MKKIILFSLCWISIFAAWAETAPIDVADEIPYISATRYPPKAQPRIINGIPAAEGAWPWAVQVRWLHGSTYSSCTGSLIAPNWVLTAGHCVANKGVIAPASQVYVLAGANDAFVGTLPSSITYSAKQVFVHNGYLISSLRGDIADDIALVKLSTSLPFTPISLLPPEQAALVSPGVVATVVGWGLINSDPREQPETLMQVELPIVSQTTCQRYFGSIPDGVLCAGGTNKDICSGDSGGPLMLFHESAWRLAGVTSFGSATGCGRAIPSGFTRVTYYADWIKNTIAAATDAPTKVEELDLEPTDLPQLVLGEEYFVRYSAYAPDAVEPYTYSADRLPEGLTLTSNGYLYGTVDASTPEQVFEFTLTVEDTGPNIRMKQLNRLRFVHSDSTQVPMLQYSGLLLLFVGLCSIRCGCRKKSAT